TESIQAILGLADNACYQAKQLGRNRIQLYRQEHPLPTAASEGNRLRSRLTAALETDSFCLYQQPITSTNPRLQQHTFCEVLLRLDKKTTDSNQSNNTKSKSTQLMPPTAFLPSAERYHLMPRIDRWVIEAVLWHIANHSCQAQSIFSINLSAASLEDNSFLTFLQQQLSRYPVRPERLCFEISEKAAIANLQQTIRFTTALKQMGCQIALDDFGSGLSALTYLQKIPVDYLKLDGDFIREIANDPLIYTMLKATNQVSQFMGIKTIAKSVENIAILHKIRSIGIDYIQGYHNSKPQPLLCLEPQAEAMYASTAADHALAAQTPCSPALPKIT
ncbi:MAG: GGDEF domain-containing phosphodiesterase, partial [Cyanobacteria bacterium P01_C01_bin.121]